MRRTISYIIMASSRSHRCHHTRRHRIPRNHGQYKYYWFCTINIYIYVMSPWHRRHRFTYRRERITAELRRIRGICTQYIIIAIDSVILPIIVRRSTTWPPLLKSYFFFFIIILCCFELYFLCKNCVHDKVRFLFLFSRRLS